MSVETLTTVLTGLGIIIAMIGIMAVQSSGLRKEFKNEITELRTEMREEIGGLRTEMREEIGGLRTEMVALGSRIDSQDAKLSTMSLRLDNIVDRLPGRTLVAIGETA